METFRRTFGTLFVPSGCQRSLLLATYDDSFGAEDCEIEVVVQSLLGCDSKTSAAQAKEMLLKRMRDNWTWKVVLKVLLILHRLIVSPCSTPRWLQSFFENIDTLSICQSFREGEGTDAQAESHTAVIRKYAAYLQLLTSEMTKRSPRYTKDARLDSSMFRDRDEEEIFSLIHLYAILMHSCFSSLMNGDEMAKITGFSEISAEIALSLLKDGLQFYKVLSIAGLELLDRFPRLHPDDIKVAEIAYEAYRKCSDQIQTVLSFVQQLPELGNLKLPYFQTPPAAPELYAKRRHPTDDRFTIDSSSSLSSYDRPRRRRRSNKSGKTEQKNRSSSNSPSLHSRNEKIEREKTKNGSAHRYKREHRSSSFSSSSRSSNSVQRRMSRSRRHYKPKKSDEKCKKNQDVSSEMSQGDCRREDAVLCHISNVSSSATDLLELQIEPQPSTDLHSCVAVDTTKSQIANLLDLLELTNDEIKVNGGGNSSDNQYKHPKNGTVVEKPKKKDEFKTFSTSGDSMKPNQEMPQSTLISNIPLPLYPHPTHLAETEPSFNTTLVSSNIQKSSTPSSSRTPPMPSCFLNTNEECDWLNGDTSNNRDNFCEKDLLL